VIVESKLVGLKENIEDENSGFFGPGSHLWLNHQYIIRAIGYPVAVIIIAANPVVFEIISSYLKTSKALKDHISVTKKYSFSFVFGDKRTALNASNALKASHQKIKHSINGTIHSPLEPDLMLWVFAAIYYTSKQMNELLLMDIPFNEKTYAEYKILGTLYGISEQYLPETMDSFEQYWNKALCEHLVVSEECKAYVNSKFKLSVTDIFLNNKFPVCLRFIFKPVDQFIRLFCIYLIPQQLADAFDLHMSRRQRLSMTYILKCIRWVHSILPKRLTVETKVRLLVKG